MTTPERSNPNILPRNFKAYRKLPLHSSNAGDNLPRAYRGSLWNIPKTAHWRYAEEGFARLIKANRIEINKSSLCFVYFQDDYPASEINNIWDDTGPEQIKDYVVQTSTKIVERCILMATDPGDLVLDPTCGSGTTAFSAEKWGRRWITIDTSRVALALARARIMGAQFDWYLLSDSLVGKKRQLNCRVGLL